MTQDFICIPGMPLIPVDFLENLRRAVTAGGDHFGVFGGVPIRYSLYKDMFYVDGSDVYFTLGEKPVSQECAGPEIPFEVHNTRKVDPALAMKAVRDMCS